MEVNNQNDKIPVEDPFFIIGPQRSGTTLLRLMLSSHSRLIIPPESHFIPDLIYFPQKHLASVCEFLEETYEPEMIEFYRSSSNLVPDWEKTWHAQTKSSLNPGNIGKWRLKFKPSEIRLIEMLAGDELTKSGYPLERPDTSFKDLLWIYNQLCAFLYRKIKKWIKGSRKRLSGTTDIIQQVKNKS